MKKTLLLTLLLTVTLTSGCPAPQNGNNGNINAGNTNSGNTNTGNTNESPAVLRNPKNKAIQIYVYEVGGERKVAIAPESIKLPDDSHRLRFSIFNGLNDDINEIKIVLEDMGGPWPGFDDSNAGDGVKVFKRGKIETGEEEDTKGNFRKANGSGKYTYKIYIDGQQTETKTDRLFAPQIEIGG